MLYIGTNQGCLIFDIKKEDYTFLGDDFENYSHIFKIIQFKNNIYIGSSTGIKVTSVDYHNFLVNNSELELFNDKVVYNLAAVNESIFIASEIGLYKFNLKSDKLELISNVIIFHLDVNENEEVIASNKNKVFIVKENLEHIISIKNIHSLCYANDFIWINNKRKTSLFDIKDNELYEYDYLDGIPGDLINHLECDNEWVWFSTYNGLAMYNWSRYHFNE